jgi:hypothetical protein
LPGKRDIFPWSLIGKEKDRAKMEEGMMRFTAIFWLVFLAGALWAGCGDDDSSGGGDTDTVTSSSTAEDTEVDCSGYLEDCHAYLDGSGPGACGYRECQVCEWGITGAFADLCSETAQVCDFCYENLLACVFAIDCSGTEENVTNQYNACTDAANTECGVTI